MVKKDFNLNKQKNNFLTLCFCVLYFMPNRPSSLKKVVLSPLDIVNFHRFQVEFERQKYTVVQLRHGAFNFHLKKNCTKTFLF